MKTLLLCCFSVALLLPAGWQANSADIVSYKIFYNSSAWDNNDTNINSSDDAAIATDKAALLPGQTSAFTNFTSYNLGINGIMIDFSGLADSPSLSDFTFIMGNSSDVNSWVAAPTPSDLAFRSGAGDLLLSTINKEYRN